MLNYLHKWTKLFKRRISHRNRWIYQYSGYCHSCGNASRFMSSPEIQTGLNKIIASWDLSDNFKKLLIERESSFCAYCLANFRMRVHAESVMQLLGLPRTKDLLKTNVKIYETAKQNVLRIRDLDRSGNYICSEYFDDAEFGMIVNGVRNENLERLTFPDNSFDVLINSDVLEHVADLSQALSEIHRVLKPGGLHVFTIPVDNQLTHSRERARINSSGEVEHLMPPETHGDSIRGEGILAFRNFGRDTLDYLAQDGAEYGEIPYHLNGQYITSVYFSRKSLTNTDA